MPIDERCAAVSGWVVDGHEHTCRRPHDHHQRDHACSCGYEWPVELGADRG